MYSQTIDTLANLAAVKILSQRQSLFAHLVRSMLAGMYVAAAIVLIFIIGGCLSKDSPGAVRLAMGVCFGGSLTFVIFAGSELFTGANMVLTLGVLAGKTTWRQLAANWIWTWIGNLAGAVLIAAMVVRSGLLDADPINGFVLKLVAAKMNLLPVQIILRGILANWMVCLAVWMTTRVVSETARLVLIWWCLFTFITCGYEHSIANMSGLMLGVLLPHPAEISLAGYFYNLALSTFGNIIGGAVFVAMFYWAATPKNRGENDECRNQNVESMTKNE